jgi:hypothetical protein
MSTDSVKVRQEAARGLEDPAVLDAMVVDEAGGRLVLVMVERRPWTGGELQLWQLQEKLNAYVSFALDGEMEEIHPELRGKPVCIQLRCEHDPTPEVMGLVERVREQLKFMEIDFEVWHTGEDAEPRGCCGNGGCSSCE